ncbi:MAG: AAA family ATPase [Clostridiales bacterium]|nr:AAA family ATPase [Clostridiales bacterium]
MGIYLNPGNKGFQTILNGIYVDKTGLIDFVNRMINTPQKLTSFSRPRRFGKSFAAKMLCAYYDKSCDSRALFEGLEIAKKDSFEKYLNKYDVIYLDITWFIARSKNKGKNVVLDIQTAVIDELRKAFLNCVDEDETFLPDALLSVSHNVGNQFIIIIDEWDAFFREAKNDDALQREYIQLLRGLFKGGTATDETIAAAYMTGILPIKKYGTESALTDFKEYSMIRPGRLAQYVGFTEDEVKRLCDEYQMKFDDMQSWYDGYSFSRVKHVYSPDSVMNALQEEEIANYWTQTETFESLKKYIEINMDGLKDAIVLMLGGQKIQIDISTFQNDITSFRNKDDVLTLLIHVGYLAYDQKAKEVYIPNQEVTEAFQSSVKGGKWNFADYAFIPGKDTDKPAMIIELKYDKDADTAIRQIRENRCDGDLKNYFGNLLLAGINYDKDAKGMNAKRHSCVIEKV